MLNKTQKKILDIGSVKLKDIKELNLEYIKNLGNALGKELSTNENSNVYIMANQHNLDLVNASTLFLNILKDINVFFDSHRFEGYFGGSYDGLRNALLDLDWFDDVKIGEMQGDNSVKVVLLFKNNKLIEDGDNDIAQIIGQTFHDNRSVGVLTTEKDNDFSVGVCSSAGQQHTYFFHKGIRRKFDMLIEYTRDDEELILNYDFRAQIIEVVNKIYKDHYGVLGKDFKIQDFLSISREVSGAADLAISLNDEEGNTYDNCNIAMNIKEIFEFESIHVRERAK